MFAQTHKNLIFLYYIFTDSDITWIVNLDKMFINVCACLHVCIEDKEVTQLSSEWDFEVTREVLMHFVCKIIASPFVISARHVCLHVPRMIHKSVADRHWEINRKPGRAEHYRRKIGRVCPLCEMILSFTLTYCIRETM